MNVKSVSRGESEQQGGKLSKTIVPITAKNSASVDYICVPDGILEDLRDSLDCSPRDFRDWCCTDMFSLDTA